MPRPMPDPGNKESVAAAAPVGGSGWRLLPVLAWAVGALLLAGHVAAGAAAWKAWAAYAAASGLATAVWAWHSRARSLRLTDGLRGHGWVQALAALLLAAWQPALAWAAALLWLGATAWLFWDDEHGNGLHLPAGQMALLCAMLAVMASVVVARPMPQWTAGSVFVRLLWLASLLWPLAVQGMAMWQALGRLRRSHGTELARLVQQCESLAEDVQQLQTRVGLLQAPTGRDALTGVSSFARLMDTVDELRERHARKPEPFCVVLLELDPWVEKAGAARMPNGPSLQDRVLLMLSGLLITHLRAVDGIGRYRNDTFMLVMPDTASVQAVWALQRVREGVRQRHWGETPLQERREDVLTLTLAVAEFQAGETSERLVQRAEMALMRGRSGGRNQIVIAEDVKPPRQT